MDNILISCSDYDEIKETLQKEQILNQNNYNKLQELENRLKVAKERYDLLTYGINKKIGQIAVMINEMKDIEERASKKVIKVTDEIKSKDFLIERIKEKMNRLQQQILYFFLSEQVLMQMHFYSFCSPFFLVLSKYNP